MARATPPLPAAKKPNRGGRPPGDALVRAERQLQAVIVAAQKALAEIATARRMAEARLQAALDLANRKQG